MIVPELIRPYWDKFQASIGVDVSARFYSASYFDDNEASANELAALILAGVKRATAGPLCVYEASQTPLPELGALSVVTNWQGEPLCIIETKNVMIIPFDEVNEAFAKREGEGDLSLAYWRDVHWAYCTRACQPFGIKADLKMQMVCEEFELIYIA
jgi:uncharacterized protein YhfF